MCVWRRCSNTRQRAARSEEWVREIRWLSSEQSFFQQERKGGWEKERARERERRTFTVRAVCSCPLTYLATPDTQWAFQRKGERGAKESGCMSALAFTRRMQNRTNE
jgi:hypothetical protein